MNSVNSKNKSLWNNYESWILPLVFLFVNLIQAYFTPLINDEPYYWLWSKQPALGYFDHPPLVAWLIALGTSFFQNELGVRLPGIIMGSVTLYLLYKIIEGESEKKVNLKLLALLIGSSVFVNLYSFMAIPDTPLLFFTALFLWQYKRYLENDKLVNSFITGIICALLLYSKYHGILVIGFTLLSNLSLFKKKSFYIVLITALIFFIPHLFWQYENGFVTFRFHLMDKISEFKPTYILSYIGEQILLSGPFVLLLFTLLNVSKNRFQHTLKFVSLGIFLFFLVSSFRGMVNAYWTVAAWPGLIVLAYCYIDDHKWAKKLAQPLLVFSIIIVMAIRLIFLTNLYPIPHFNNRNPKLMVAELNKITDKPLVFVNSLIDPALYLFYGKRDCYAINNANYKKTQFNYLLNHEAIVQGSDVTLVSPQPVNDQSRMVEINKGRRYYLTDYNNFRSFQTTAWVDYVVEHKKVTAGSEVSIPVTINISEQNYINSSFDFQVTLNLLNMKTRELYQFAEQLDSQSISGFNFRFMVPYEKGTYKCFFSINANSQIAILNTYNSKITYLEVVQLQF